MTTRPTYRVGRFDYLPSTIEYDLTNLLMKEISFMRKLEDVKMEIQKRYDYGTYTAFRTVDRLNESYINIDNLKTILKYHSYYLTDRDLLAIIRRIDTDGDAKISYGEFSEFMKLEAPVYKALDLEYDLRSRSMSEKKRMNVSVNNSSPLRSSMREASPAKKNVTFIQEEMSTPVKKTDLNNSRAEQSLEKTAEKSTSSPFSSPYKSPVTQDIEDETVRCLRD